MRELHHAAMAQRLCTLSLLAGTVMAMTIAGTGCVGVGAPLLEPRISAALNKNPMRRLDTSRLSVYYPDHRREEALRMAARLERCVVTLDQKKRIRNQLADRKYVVLMPDAPYNNAFVAPPSSATAPFSVIPTYATLSPIREMGLPLDPSIAGCHEMVHYVHLTQIAGVFGVLNAVFGDVMTPQIGLESWFMEGLATYYEGQLQPGVGRLNWPVWRGYFHASFAGGEIQGGDLNALHRPFHWGPHYLVGSHFIEFIVERYGEEKLWSLIEVQGRAALFPLGVSLRYRSVYGKTLPALFDEFKQHIATRFPKRPRPHDQLTVTNAGEDAKYATGLDGSEALLFSSGDEPARIVVRGPDGKQRASRNLVDILPGRTVIEAAPLRASGLSLTADGNQVFFVTVDQGQVQERARLLRFDVRTQSLAVIADDLVGVGGAVSPTGDRYFFTQAVGDRRDVAVMDLASKQVKTLVVAAPRSYYTSPRPDPTGTKLVVSWFDGQSFKLSVLDAQTGQTLDTITSPQGPVDDGAFRDDNTILYLGAVEGRFQVHEYNLRAGTSVQLSQAPYLAYSPRARAGKVRFLNRDAHGWSVDEIAGSGVGAVAFAKAAPAASSRDTAAADAPSSGGLTKAALVGKSAAGVVPTAQSEEASLRVTSERPYSSWDGLFTPSLHALAYVQPQSGVALAGLTLSGTDRLQRHRWGITGLYAAKNHFSGIADYYNRQRAPFTLAARVSQLQWALYPDGDITADPDLDRRQQRASFAVARTFYTTQVQLGGEYVTSRTRPRDAVAREQRLGGPLASIQYHAAEATPFSGYRRRLLLRLAGAYHPSQLSSFSSSFGELEGAVAATTPLPLSRRHTLHVSARARALPGQDQALLQVGGATPFSILSSRSSESRGPAFNGGGVLPEDVKFFEPLRGFEDYALALNRVAIGAATYRLPFRFDYGFTSGFNVLPSVLFRQIDFEGFVNVAADRAASANAHAAAGGSLGLDLALGGLIGFSVRYQLARRLTDDKALVHLLTLSTLSDIVGPSE